MSVVEQLSRIELPLLAEQGHQAVWGSAPVGQKRMLAIKRALIACCVALTVSATAYLAYAEAPGKIIGWGSQVVGVDLDSGFKAVAAGGYHSLGLKA